MRSHGRVWSRGRELEDSHNHVYTGALEKYAKTGHVESQNQSSDHLCDFELGQVGKRECRPVRACNDSVMSCFPLQFSIILRRPGLVV